MVISGGGALTLLSVTSVLRDVVLSGVEALEPAFIVSDDFQKQL